jgi:hypothetical protein
MERPYPRSKRVRAWPLLGLAIFLAALMALPRGGGDGPHDAAATVARLLAQDSEHEVSALRALSELGRSGLEPMFDALVADRTPGAAGQDVPLTSSQRGLLRRAMGATEPGLLRAFLANSLERDPQQRAFEEALLVFGPRARSQDLRFLLDVTLSGLEHGCDPAVLGAACEEVFADALERLPQAWLELPGIWRATPEALQPAMVRAVGRSGDPVGLRFLAGLLGSTDDQDENVLAAMIELAQRSQVPQGDDVCEPLRRLVEWGNSTRAQSAAVVLGVLRDEGAIPALIDALDGESRGLQNQAGRALEAITGLSFRNEPRRWRAWYEEEHAWFEEHGDAALEALHSEEETRAFESVRSLARRRLHRQEIAEELATLLGHESPSLRRCIPGALAQLGSTKVVPALVDALEDEDAEVARGACKALGTLTGLDLPQEPEAWRSALLPGQ